MSQEDNDQEDEVTPEPRKDEELYELIISKLAELYGLLPDDEVTRATIFSAIHIEALQRWYNSTLPKEAEEDIILYDEDFGGQNNGEKN